MPAPTATRTSGTDSARDVVRWGAFCCALVPLVLLACGSALTVAAGAAASLSALTAVCWGLLTLSRSAGTGATALPPRRGVLRSGGGAHRAGGRTRS